MRQTLVIAFAGLLLTGCASRYRGPGDEPSAQFTVKNETRGAMVLLYEDENCTKHRYGEWLGSVGKGKPLSPLPTERTFFVPVGEPVVLQMLWTDGYGRGCGGALKVAPRASVNYKFVYAYMGGTCAFSGYKWDANQNEFVLMSDGEAKPVEVCRP